MKQTNNVILNKFKICNNTLFILNYIRFEKYIYTQTEQVEIT